MDAVPGGVLGGRYEVGVLVGLGGTARVFRAHDQVDDATVALKIFPTGLGHEGVHRDGSRELAALSGMVHPGLVGVRDSGVDADGRPFVVMDFVDGQSLAARLRDGALPAAAVTAMGATLADALAHVHARGVVHRDVKPGNVLLDRAGHARLTDFGIARLVDATRVTATGLVVGTAAYMAPEQVRGEVVGPPADVYALGLVLLEAVTGRREFEGGALEAAIARLHRSPVVPGGVPEPLARQIRRMTAPDPDERPAAPDVAAALRRPPGRRGGLEGPLARRLVSAGALASLAASAVAATVLLTGADSSAAGPQEPPLVVAAPAPAAVPPTTGTTGDSAAITSAGTLDTPTDVPGAVAPTTARRIGPVPVALARPDPARTVTRRPAAERPATRTTDPADDRADDRGRNGGSGGRDDRNDRDDRDEGPGGDPADHPAPPAADPVDPDGPDGGDGENGDGDDDNSGPGNGHSGNDDSNDDSDNDDSDDGNNDDGDDDGGSGSGNSGPGNGGDDDDTGGSGGSGGDDSGDNSGGDDD